jgi:hypothetical protein
MHKNEHQLPKRRASLSKPWLDLSLFELLGGLSSAESAMAMRRTAVLLGCSCLILSLFLSLLSFLASNLYFANELARLHQKNPIIRGQFQTLPSSQSVGVKVDIEVVDDNDEPDTNATTNIQFRPPLESLVQDWHIVGDVSSLLNVAVVAFPKCGTSTLMEHLNTHPEIQMFTKERCDLGSHQETSVVRDLYNMPLDKPVRGLKCPQQIESTAALESYQKYFPKTKLIVGTRHPVLW